jgi:hypothetical protein
MDALNIGADKAIAAIGQSSYLPGQKASALGKLESYKAMSLPVSAAAITLHQVRSVKPWNFDYIEILTDQEV